MVEYYPLILSLSAYILGFFRTVYNPVIAFVLFIGPHLINT